MNLSDKQLIQKTLADDLRAYDELMKRYERLVFKVAYSFGGSRENALDITQATFLKAFDQLDRFRHQSQFKTWLMQIAYREGVNWTRREKRYVDNSPLDEEFDAPSPSPDLDSKVLDQERRRQLLAALDKLSSKQRLALVLRYFQGLSIDEISDVLQMSNGVTRNLLFRSLRKMRDHLTQTSYFKHSDLLIPTKDSR